ncbi:hypothetical protein DPMN_156159 [Dreissena polymorpha]|uniref:Uncharacterized protein n=1 Tax=Dreissena polymorpha TaxID=45954 RepID=A0A9D4FT24_DREPO|nr:hypothetical protein DPMN_156159 [Dreissena polymorpha]
MLKFDANQQTNQQTNRQGKNNMSPYINKTNVLTKFHDDIKNVTSRVFTRFFYSHIEKMLPYPLWGPYIYITNVFTKFHDDWAKIVTSRENAPPSPGSHVLQRTGSIFELKSQCSHWRPCFSPIWSIFELVRDINNILNNHVFQRTGTIFELNSHWAKIENCPASWWPCFSPIWTIFELVRNINKTNVLTKFHDDWAIIVTSRVFTWITTPPTCGHVFQRTGTTFELNQHIIKTNILTNFELDRGIIGTNLLTKNVASRVFTNQMWMDERRTDDGQRPILKAHLSNQTQLLIKFSELTNGLKTIAGAHCLRLRCKQSLNCWTTDILSREPPITECFDPLISIHSPGGGSAGVDQSPTCQ